jgi:heme a synthase
VVVSSGERVGGSPAVGGGVPRRASRVLRPVLVANLVAQIAIVVTGGLVRLTGSGLGCPTWPQCVPGSYRPVVTQEQGWHKYVEFGNRMMATVVSVVALAALVVVVRHVRAGLAGRRLVVLGAIPLVGCIVQAIVGGVTVHSDLNPNIVAPHFLISEVLVAVSVVLLLEAGPPPPAQPAKPPIRVLAVLLCVVATAVVVLGTLVTGSGPHSGDAEKPARLGLDPRTMSWVHADAVWLFVGLVAALLLTLSLTKDRPAALRRGWWLLGVTLLQGAIGYTQYALDLPIALVALHMLGASLLVTAVAAAAHGVLSTRRAPA